MDSRERIRMPNWQNIKSKSWPKELLMTFIGATLSILLTFGTAGILDEKQKRADGRQTAMMAIHDMENSADLFHAYVTAEEKSFNTTQYILANVNNLDSISLDSLLVLVNYVVAPGGKLFNYDDSSERVFLSSQDVWKNISNAAFIDAVQDFYHERRTVFASLNDNKFFARAVTNDEYYEMLSQYPNLYEMQEAFYRDFIKNIISRKEVNLYICNSFVRRRYFNNYADEFVSAANKCKFMLGITDEELEEYVRNRRRTGKPLTESKLFGKWKVQTTADLNCEQEFKRDHTVVARFINYMSYSYYTGQAEFIYTIRGTWELRGDSLTTILLPGYDYELDRSKIKYQPENEESVNNILNIWEQTIVSSLDELSAKGEQNSTDFVSISATGDKIEMQSTIEDENGIKKTVSQYMLRIKD